MRKILLTAALVAPVLLQQAAAQNRQISGRVTDRATGQGLPGVTVLVKGTTNGVSTNSDGSYTISAPATATTLSFSSIGFVAVERAIGDASTIDIGLATDSKQLNEVVVTAVGIERQEKTLAYSVDVINNRSLTQGRETNPIAGLQGKVSGVNISKSGGGVNSATRITLRGQRSLQQDNQPLFVVDGIPIDNSNTLATNAGVDTGNRVGDINPDDIETMTVLKGPSAAALYGSRASNGAIIITTKTGKDAAIRGKKAEITYTSSFTGESVLKFPDFQNSYGSGYDLDTYIPYENTNYGPRFDGSPVQLGPPALDGSIQTIPYSAVKDNVKDFFNTGTTFQNTLAFQGGTAKSNFYLSFSDAKSKGIIPDDEFRRNTLKLTAATSLANKVTASTSINYNHNKTDVTWNESNAGVINNVFQVSRQVDLSKYKDLNDKFSSRDGFFNGYYANPYQTIDDNRYISNLDRVIGNVTLGYAATDWLNFTYRIGSDVSFDRRKERSAIASYVTRAGVDRPTATPGYLREGSIFVSDLTSDLLATIKRDITPDFSFQLILGNNIRSRNTQSTGVVANALALPGFYNLSTRIGELGGEESTNRRRLVGAYGDLTLSFRDYLFVTATGRNDWTSTLPKSNRSYFYPSAGVGFVFTEAISALKDNTILTYGKLRASYAQVGSDTDAYQLNTTTPAGAGFPYGSNVGYTLSNTSNNPDLKPERTTSYEGGIEFGFLDDRIGGEATYYQSRTTDQIIRLGVPSTTLFSQANLNVGEVKNKGFESSLRITPVRTESGFRWDIGANFSTNKNEVVSLIGNIRALDISTSLRGVVAAAVVGESFPMLRGSAFLRDPQGRVVVNGTTGYPIRDTQTRNLGQVNPKYIIGGNMTFAYKGLRLTGVIDMRRGGYMYSGTKYNLAFTGSSVETAEYDRLPFVYPNSVIQNADGTFTPNTTVKTADGGFDLFYSNLSNAVAEYNIIKSDYFKLREVSLTYDLPQTLLEKSPFGRASIGVNGRNLLLFVPGENKFIDPESNLQGSSSNIQGIEYNGIPTTRSYGANLTITF
ncbi:SusC/RagA family TonB-linked outer membrane protein [Hymenobacter perfusus]|uniref:SusC/RagA family TonB-linked outer membrane protein n=1 Tax=Hymenobacter perfusus TaxID=1236770 RepID=A0A3R9P779_9BACT|nr:SusC/RagA family TonB-linked outer membrane protein [Hymenobacter perfusus]RSK45717.1 SusC/RagA family TonB-linked outer membrane protein [Hymenobacter perfusus]